MIKSAARGYNRVRVHTNFLLSLLRVHESLCARARHTATQQQLIVPIDERESHTRTHRPATRYVRSVVCPRRPMRFWERGRHMVTVTRGGGVARPPPRSGGGKKVPRVVPVREAARRGGVGPLEAVILGGGGGGGVLVL